MSKITDIIGYSNFEVVRDKIAEILAIELSNQKSLNELALINEELKPNPDQLLIDLYKMNISCIPNKIFLEKMERLNPIDFPYINVVLINVPLDESTSQEYQIGINRYQVQFYQTANNTENESGDTLSTKKLHRLQAISRAILMDKNYTQLDLDIKFGVGSVRVEEIITSPIEEGSDTSGFETVGKFDVLVKITETVNDLTGVLLEISSTNFKINESEKGYYFEITT